MGSKNSKPSIQQSTTPSSSLTSNGGDISQKKADSATVTVKVEEKGSAGLNNAQSAGSSVSAKSSSIPIVRETVSAIDEQRNPQDAIILTLDVLKKVNRASATQSVPAPASPAVTPKPEVIVKEKIKVVNTPPDPAVIESLVEQKVKDKLSILEEESKFKETGWKEKERKQSQTEAEIRKELSAIKAEKSKLEKDLKDTQKNLNKATEKTSKLEGENKRLQTNLQDREKKLLADLEDARKSSQTLKNEKLDLEYKLKTALKSAPTKQPKDSSNKKITSSSSSAAKVSQRLDSVADKLQVPSNTASSGTSIDPQAVQIKLALHKCLKENGPHHALNCSHLVQDFKEYAQRIIEQKSLSH